MRSNKLRLEHEHIVVKSFLSKERRFLAANVVLTVSRMGFSRKAIRRLYFIEVKTSKDHQAPVAGGLVSTAVGAGGAAANAKISGKDPGEAAAFGAIGNRIGSALGQASETALKEVLPTVGQTAGAVFSQAISKLTSKGIQQLPNANQNQESNSNKLRHSHVCDQGHYCPN